jgi:hypothetical protein
MLKLSKQMMLQRYSTPYIFKLMRYKRLLLMHL